MSEVHGHFGTYSDFGAFMLRGSAVYAPPRRYDTRHATPRHAKNTALSPYVCSVSRSYSALGDVGNGCHMA